METKGKLIKKLISFHPFYSRQPTQSKGNSRAGQKILEQQWMDDSERNLQYPEADNTAGSSRGSTFIII